MKKFIYSLLIFFIALMPYQALAKRFKNSIDQEFVFIKSGSFIMGSPDTEQGRNRDERQHKVILTKNYYMQTTEVTRRQWFVIMKTKPWIKGRIKVKGWDYPVTYITWFDVKEFIKRLNVKEKITKYRLPTEAEWEYACRAGTTTKYSFGNSDSRLNKYAWYNKNVYDHGKMHCQRVKQLKPNPWGLYDMHGNVSEMCEDRTFSSKIYGLRLTDTHKNNVVDPLNTKGPGFVERGGSWLSDSSICRSANRDSATPEYSSDSVGGFRLVKSE